VLRDGGRVPASPPAPGRGSHPESRSMDTRTQPADNWRGRSNVQEPAGRTTAETPRTRSESPASQSWRNSPRSTQPQAGAPQNGQRFESDQKPAANDWRTRGQVPPARRVIEGAVPGRRSPEAGNGGSSRSYEYTPREAPSASHGNAPHSVERAPDRGPAPMQSAPAPRSQPQAPPQAAPPPSHSAPPSYSAPAPRPAPAPPSSGGGHRPPGR
jgi:hypothetical protein